MAREMASNQRTVSNMSSNSIVKRTCSPRALFLPLRKKQGNLWKSFFTVQCRPGLLQRYRLFWWLQPNSISNFALIFTLTNLGKLAKTNQEVTVNPSDAIRHRHRINNRLSHVDVCNLSTLFSSSKWDGPDENWTIKRCKSFLQDFFCVEPHNSGATRYLFFVIR